MQDAERRGLPALRPLLETLARVDVGAAHGGLERRRDAASPTTRAGRDRTRMPAEPRTIAELARALRARETTAEAVTDASASQRIAERNPSINAFITVLADQALAQARAGGPRDGARAATAGRCTASRSRSRT